LVSTWETQRGHKGRWKRHRRKRSPVQIFAVVTVAVVAVGLGGRLAWQAMQARSGAGSVLFGAPVAPEDNVAGVPWQRDVMNSLDAGSRDAATGNLTAAEVDVDRAESIITASRLNSRKAKPEFFLDSLGGLDRIWNQDPDNSILFQHVTQARIELAALRSAQSGTLADAHDDAASIISPPPPALTAAAASANPASGSAAAATAPPASKNAPAGASRVSIGAPRNIDANSTLDPQTLRGNYLDATLMPETAEILLPPAARSLTDNIHVADLTIAGAAQTLDGIRWSNVTFIGTRLRYEGGEVDLDNVRFIRCTFGFTTDERGASLANAIAMGETTFRSE
jgi:hypothetical protein